MDSPHLLIILEILLHLLGIAILTLGYIISFHELRRPFIKCSEMRQWNMQKLFSPPLIDCSLFSILYAEHGSPIDSFDSRYPYPSQA